MSDKIFFYGILFGLGAFLYFKLHKWWLKDRKDNPAFNKIITDGDSIKNKLVIILLIFVSLFFLFKSI